MISDVQDRRGYGCWSCQSRSPSNAPTREVAVTSTPNSSADNDWASVFVASAVVAVVMLDTMGVSQSLPTIGTDLDASDTQIRWILNGTTLASAIALIPAGRAGDRWGRRKVGVIGLLMFGLGSIIGAVAQTIGILIVARLIVGFGMAALVATSLAIVTASVDSNSQPKAIARWTAITATGAAIGPLAAGWFTEALSWRWFLGTEALLALALAALLQHLAAESKDPTAPRSLDLAGTAALAIGLGATIYGLMVIPDHGVTAVRVVPALVVGALGLLVLLMIERREDAPLLDLGLFLRRRYLAVAVVALVANWAYAVMIFYVPLYLQTILDFGPTAAGALFLLFTVPYGALSLVVDRVESRVVPALLTAVGLGVLVVGLVVAGLITPTQGLFAVTLSLLITAVGQTLVFNVSGSQAMEMGGTSSGTASGALSTIRQLGFLLGLAVTGTIVQVSQSRHLNSELSARGIDLSISERSALLSDLSGTSSDSTSISASSESVLSKAFGSSAKASELSDQLFVDALRVGYWSVAGLCAVAILAAITSRAPRGTLDSNDSVNSG